MYNSLNPFNMNQMKKIRLIILFLFVTATSLILSAQPNPYSNGNGGSLGGTPVEPSGPNGAPLDGSMALLITLGLGYAARNFLITRKKTTSKGFLPPRMNNAQMNAIS